MCILTIGAATQNVGLLQYPKAVIKVSQKDVPQIFLSSSDSYMSLLKE